MSLHESAILCKLTVTTWHNRATDRRITNEVAGTYGIDNRDHRYIKTLIRDTPVKHLHSFVNSLRGFHMANTQPWMDHGTRILASKNFFQYQQGITERRISYENEVAHFISKFPEHKAAACTALKSMFDETLYPTAEEIREACSVNITYVPFPNVKDFRVDVGKAELTKLRENLEADLRKAERVADQHLGTLLLNYIKGANQSKKPLAMLKLKEQMESLLRMNSTNNPFIVKIAMQTQSCSNLPDLAQEVETWLQQNSK